MYLISFHLVINRDDWFLIWLGMEINIIIFIVLIYVRYRMFNIESCIKYFFIQSLGSAVFIILFYCDNIFIDIIICLSLRYKLGAGPFFYWFPSVCEGISWLSCFILISVQKVIPLILIIMFISWIVFFIVIISLLFGVLGSFNQKDLKRLIAYSSVYHLGWIFLCIMISNLSWINYILLYMCIIFPVIYFLKYKQIINLVILIKDKNKLSLVILVLRIAGIPPFLGFFLKWFAFVRIVNVDFLFLFILISSSVIMFYIYFRIIYDVIIRFFQLIDCKDFIVTKVRRVLLDLLSLIGMCLGILVSLWLIF